MAAIIPFLSKTLATRNVLMVSTSVRKMCHVIWVGYGIWKPAAKDEDGSRVPYASPLRR